MTTPSGTAFAPPENQDGIMHQERIRRILVINAGSSSIKFRLFDMQGEMLLLSGVVERIGEAKSSCSYHDYSTTAGPQLQHESAASADHVAGMQQIFALLEHRGVLESKHVLQAIGHRVVHGGATFHTATRIDSEVRERIRALIPLAPLHNPANLLGIEAAQQLCPEVPQVAVFDTAFFRTLPPQAYRYALPNDLYTQHQVRRYGFHGTSHQYVAQQAAVVMQRPLHDLRLITLHLGNGASAAAIREGVCIDTSMGMTPLEGLIMGTRCGDVDPSVHFYLARTMHMDLDTIEHLLNHASGLQGLCGSNDMREVHRLANHGDSQAQLAITMYCYRICKYIGAYYAVLGGLDALVFTAGIGENDPEIRQLICDGLSGLGIELDPQRNLGVTSESRSINRVNSKINVMVIPTNEELAIARQTRAVLNNVSTSK